MNRKTEISVRTYPSVQYNMHYCINSNVNGSQNELESDEMSKQCRRQTSAVSRSFQRPPLSSLLHPLEGHTFKSRVTSVLVATDLYTTRNANSSMWLERSIAWSLVDRGYFVRGVHVLTLENNAIVRIKSCASCSSLLYWRWQGISGCFRTCAGQRLNNCRLYTVLKRRNENVCSMSAVDI